MTAKESRTANPLDHARAEIDELRERLGISRGDPLFDEDRDYKDINADYLTERYYPEERDA